MKKSRCENFGTDPYTNMTPDQLWKALRTDIEKQCGNCKHLRRPLGCKDVKHRGFGDLNCIRKRSNIKWEWNHE